MSFFSTSGETNGVTIRHTELLSKKIVVTKYWTRRVRLIKVDVPYESSYWLVEVVDLGIGRHSYEYQRSTYEEARKVFDSQSNFRLPAQVEPLKFGRD